MGKEVNLSIILPSRIYLQEKVSSVIIPAVRADIDILPDRAPSVFALDFGLLQILNEKGGVKDSYFVHSGMAQVADNECKVMVQGIAPASEMPPHIVKKKLEEAQTEQMKLFYQMILDYQRGVRRRYLRTLQLYSKKLKQRTGLKKFVFGAFSKKETSQTKSTDKEK
ncbi:MAG: F0F1 ATP synthase subunit epsilon [Alphaproteobacteria bacterium]|nr:F0F1 ATP synthase subunit epsilon [Alphaproteobacteria bacterium]